MSLITLNLNLDRSARALERIADCLERAFPPAMLPVDEKPRGIESLSKQTNADRAKRERDRKEKARQEGLT